MEKMWRLYGTIGEAVAPRNRPMLRMVLIS